MATLDFDYIIVGKWEKACGLQTMLDLLLWLIQKAITLMLHSVEQRDNI